MEGFDERKEEDGREVRMDDGWDCKICVMVCGLDVCDYDGGRRVAVLKCCL